MKNFFESEKPLLWDDPIPSKERSAWIQLISEAVLAGECIFPRKTCPGDAVAGPRIAGFGDEAFPAFGGCVYLIWEHARPDVDDCTNVHCLGLDGGHFSAYLALAKGRVTPLNDLAVKCQLV